MLSSTSTIVTLLLLLSPALTQTTTIGISPQFSSAASELISKYIPTTILPSFESAISSAANAASVSGDAKSLLYSALLETSVPDWFTSAVPTGWNTQISALEGDINALRTTLVTASASSSEASSTPVVIAVTTTDSAGSTITTSVTSSSKSVSATGSSSGGSGTITTTATTDHPLSGAGSTASSLTTKVVSGITSVLTVAVSGATSVASGAKSVGSSLVSEATGSTSSSSGGAAIPTAASGAAAGVLGIVGVMIAL